MFHVVIDCLDEHTHLLIDVENEQDILSNLPAIFRGTDRAVYSKKIEKTATHLFNVLDTDYGVTTIDLSEYEIVRKDEEKEDKKFFDKHFLSSE